MIRTENNKIYIVMYHYVREIKKSKYPNLKGLEYDEFKRQIDYFNKNFNILSNDEISEILISKKIPKKKSILLTFDDGYKDHFKYVYPYLTKKKLSAIFYPSVMCVKNKKVLDVNKIHFILEKEQDRDKLLNLIFFFTKKILKKNPDELKLNKIVLKGRYDDKKTILIKRLLQNHLPLREREKIVNKVFKYVLDIDEEDFSSHLYMDTQDVSELYNNNFTIGSHGYNHFWWGKINKKSQEKEIKESIDFFKKINVFDKNFSVCFPHGSYNSETNTLLEKHNIKFALTTKVGHVNKNNIRNKFRLPRFDTNDFK